MAGLIFIALLIGWFYFARWIARKITSPVQNKLLRTSLTGLLIAAFSALLVSDEIIGGFQFRAICEKSAELKIDAQKIKGRTIARVVNSSNEEMNGTAIRVYGSRFSYVDVKTGEELATYGRFTAEGGRLIRFLSGGHPMPPLLPLSQHGNTCSMREQGNLAAKFGFIYRDLSEIKNAKD